jgi:hypothetical protein
MRYLVVAHRTADSAELMDRLLALAAADPAAEFVLLVPATLPNYLDEVAEGRVRPASVIAAERASRIRDRMLGRGLNLAGARVGAWDPIQAIEDELRAETYSTIVISTLPPGISRWLRMDVPARLARRYPQLEFVHVVAGRLSSSETAPPTGPELPAVDGASRVRIQLDGEEVQLLDRVLSSYLGELRMEVRVTDNRRLRAELKHEEEILRRLITRLQEPASRERRSRAPAGPGPDESPVARS